MDGLLNWVGNILFFLVLITVAENLLPGKKYNKYIRLCAGMVLILLVVRPLTAGFHLEEQINRYFESFAFQQEARDLSKEILGIEQQRLGQIIDSYEQVVETDLDAMARVGHQRGSDNDAHRHFIPGIGDDAPAKKDKRDQR